MSALRSMRSLAARIAIVGVVAFAAAAASAEAQETVRITTHATASFPVTDVSVSTAHAVPANFMVSFNQLTVTAGHVLKISVQADAANFTSPSSGTAIPASKLSWTIGAATNGTGFGGTLSSSAYGLVFQSDLTKNTGSVKLNWALAPPSVTQLRAGAHTLSVRWKLESITP